jgi:hypothetical protein
MNGLFMDDVSASARVVGITDSSISDNKLAGSGRKCLSEERGESRQSSVSHFLVGGFGDDDDDVVISENTS